MQSNDIVVSISCITYNHAPYIRQCLDGFMMQKTDFAFEVLIHDDASTDGTAEIIKEYEAKYPNIIKPIYEEENQWIKGRRGSVVFNFPRAKGKYIALCEGDDYWTDPLKLQKQVDFLESNDNYSICGHRFLAYDETAKRYYDYDTGINGTYQLTDLINKGRFCSTLSILFKRSALDIKSYCNCRCHLDIVLAYLLLEKGMGYCIPEVMAVYRVHNGGVWSGANSDVHHCVNFDVRLALYELKRNKDSAIFIISYLKRFGRRWMLKNARTLIKAFRYIQEQFGMKYTMRLICMVLFF